MNPFSRKNKKSKEEKEQEKLDELMKQYNLDNLSEEDKKFARGITYKLWGTGLIRFGTSSEDAANIGLLQGIIDQNFLLAKLIDENNKKLDEISRKLDKE